jgi:carbon-monoxide dehydrogenase small subunit
MVEDKRITLEVNGEGRDVAVPANWTLLDALRHLGHVEVKSGCEKGDCGACAVLVDGQAVDACLMLAWTAEGRAITTVAGLGGPDDPHPLHTAFIDHGAVQCGYCIPGMIVAAKALLDENPEPSEEDIRRGLGGNLCRCTGYTRIFTAVREAAAVLRQKGEAA